MGSIPTKAMSGDVAIGRNVSTGGGATVRGSATVGHNLRVEGWLEARNIKDTNKGVFESVERLQEAYPQPERGWWALVMLPEYAGHSQLGQLFIAKDGVWVGQLDADGEPLLKGRVTVDDVKLREDVEQVLADMTDFDILVSENTADIEKLKKRMTAEENRLVVLTEEEYDELEVKDEGKFYFTIDN